MARTIRLTPIGTTLLTVAVGVCVGSVGQKILDGTRPSRQTDKTIKWEYLDGEDGNDLLRHELPLGWVVENADGYMCFLPDPDKAWLDESEDR